VVFADHLLLREAIFSVKFILLFSEMHPYDN